MRSRRHPSPFWITTASIAALAASALGQGPQIKLRDGAVPRTFDIATDEVVIVRKDAASLKASTDLKSTVTQRLPGAQILSERQGQVHVKLAAPLDRTRAAAGTAPALNTVEGAESLPVLYISGVERDERSRRIVTSELLVRIPEGSTAEAVGAQVGAVSTKETRLRNFTLLRLPNAFRALDAAEKLQQQGYVVEPQLGRQMQKRELPNDPFFKNQWHLYNTGQGNGIVGIDANVRRVWDLDIKGKDVTIAIVDDSFETTHEDLAPNTLPVASGIHYDFNDDDNNPEPITAVGDAHGVAVAGVAAARGNNDLGVSGSAPEATLVGLRLISGPITDLDIARALTWQPSDELHVDVSNNSWGPWDFYGVSGPGFISKQALEDAATEGRGGLGQVTVFAAGNGRYFDGKNQYEDNSNLDGFANSRFVLAVSAVDNLGLQSWYSEPGANILVAAPSNGGTLGVFTTDVTGNGGYNPGYREPTNRNYTNSFGGTSSAAPLTTGGVALMLAANPQLGWRDVHEILASTAKQIQPADPDWVINGGGFKFNHKWGGGMIDLTAAVIRAKNWENLAAEESETVFLMGPNVPASIPDNDATGVTRIFSFTGSNLRVEHVELKVDIAHSHRSDLEITLTSPSGVKSVMIPNRPRPSDLPFSTTDTDTNYADWTFSSTHHWGENSEGPWTLTIRDRATGSVGTLNSASVSLYGTPAPKQRVRFTDARTTVQETAAAPHTITVERLGGTTGAVSVDYVFSPDGSATLGSDYTGANGTINFADGQTTATISVPIINDTTAEGPESLFVLLKNPVGAALGGVTVAEVQIQDDEANTVSIIASDAVATETTFIETPDTGTFTVSFQAPVLVDTEVFFELSGTATEVADYKRATNKVTIPAGRTSATVTIEPQDDRIIEGVESIVAQITPNANYAVGTPNQAQITLFDNEKTDVSLVASTNSVMENDPRPIVFTITRRSAAPEPLELPLIIGGSAREGTDYTPALPRSVTIPADQRSVQVTITAKDDHVYTAPRVLTVRVGDRPEFGEGFRIFAQVTFRENDPAPDIKAPKVVITEPKKGAKIQAPAETLLLKGTATDNVSITNVVYRVNGNPRKDATGTTEWSANIAAEVVYGPNVVEVFAVDNDGNESPLASVKFDYHLSHVLTVQMDNNGTVRGASGPRLVGYPVTLVATPKPGFVFGGWVDGSETLLSTARTFTFPMPSKDVTVRARFMANPFTSGSSLTGSYAGLVQSPTIATDRAGFLQLNLLTSGRFSGVLHLAGTRYPVKGEFTGDGRFQGIIPRKFPQSQLTLDLTVDVTDSPQGRITGTVSSVDFITPESPTGSSIVLLERAAFSNANPAPTAIVGRYTLHFPAAIPPVSATPHGQGYGTLTLSKTGQIKWTGVLPDGTKASQSAALTKDHKWPLFLTPYKAGGMALGSVTIQDTEDSHMDGVFHWIKSANPKDRYFSLGFVRHNAAFLASRYVVPAKRTRILKFFDNAEDNSGQLLFRDGNLTLGAVSREFEKSFTLATNNVPTITDQGAEKLKLKFSPATGTFSGSFIHPISRKNTTFAGAVFQLTGEAYGLFSGTLPAGSGLQTGQVTIVPAPPAAPDPAD